jgi:hypothetical protein
MLELKNISFTVGEGAEKRPLSATSALQLKTVSS